MAQLAGVLALAAQLLPLQPAESSPDFMALVVGDQLAVTGREWIGHAHVEATAMTGKLNQSGIARGQWYWREEFSEALKPLLRVDSATLSLRC